jgi:hypothetical protein
MYEKSHFDFELPEPYWRDRGSCLQLCMDRVAY